MQYSQMIKYIINKKAENTTLRFFVYPFLENTHNTSCNCPCPWLHPPTDNTSDRRTIGRKKHKGLSTLKLSCPHSCHFSFCFPAVQSPPIRFSGDFRHFQGFPCLFPPSWLLRPLCALYRLPRASILETPALPQVADLLWAWCPFSFGGCTVLQTEKRKNTVRFTNADWSKDTLFRYDFFKNRYTYGREV